MTRVGFVGTGAIAAPMARAIARAGREVVVSERNAETAAVLANAGLGIRAAPNQSVIDETGTVFLCLRPAVWSDVLSGLSWRRDHRIISVMASVKLDDLAAVCNPASSIAATIPYAFIEHGGCPLPVVGDPAPLTELFGQQNPILPQANEEALRHHFAASSLVSGALAMIEEGSSWLGAQINDADKAEVYLANLIAGFLANMDKDRAGRSAEAKWELATPNTLNLQMVEGLATDGAFGGLPALLDRISASMEE